MGPQPAHSLSILVPVSAVGEPTPYAWWVYPLGLALGALGAWLFIRSRQRRK